MSENVLGLDVGSRTATGLAAGFVSLSVLAGTAAGVMGLGVPLRALALGASDAQVGLVKGVAGAGMLLLVVPVGFLVDHLGAGRVFRAGALAGAGVAAAVAGAASPGVLILLVACEGIFGPLRFTALTASFYGRLEAIGLEKAGWFKGALSVGLTLLGPLLGGVLARHAGFPALFAIVVALHLLGAALAALVELDGGRPRAADRPRASLRAQVSELLALLGTASLRPVLAAELLGAATFSSFSAFVVVVAVRVFRAEATVASWVLVVEGCAFIATAFVGGRLAAGRERLQVAAAAAAAAGILGTAVAPSPAALAVAGVLVGVGTGLVHVLVSSFIGRVEGAKGKLSSLVQAAAALGVTLGPLACALAGRWLPAQRVLLVLVPPFILLAWAAVRARRASPRHRDRPSGASDAITRHEGSTRMALEQQQIPRYLNDSRFIVLSTVGPEGAPAARTLASFAADGLTVYFSTGKASDKVGQIGANPNVSVLFQHEQQELPTFANVEVRGVAEVLAEGEERAKAIRLISLRNPRFRERAERGELGGNALVRVVPRKVKVVDLSNGIGPAAVSTFGVDARGARREG
jgi:MFS family permease